MIMLPKLLIFDLDGTLLRSDKTISTRTHEAIRKCREQGTLVAISTVRGEKNIVPFVDNLRPDLVIACSGALVKNENEYIYVVEFTEEETRDLIKGAREICGPSVEITVDTRDTYYWNYSVDPNIADPTWGDTTYTNYNDFNGKGIKLCIEIHDPADRVKMQERFPDCEITKFIGNDWHLVLKKGKGKEDAIQQVCRHYGFGLEEVTAFGDDLVDIGMIKLCGTGVAMGNALPEVKAAADIVIGSNNEDGIAKYLEQFAL